MRHIIIIVFFVASCLSVLAQDAATPDPTTLFTDAIEIINVKTRNFIPSVELDNEQRAILVRNLETGAEQTYPYPENFSVLNDARHYSYPPRSDGLMVFALEEYSTAPEEIILFDPAIGAFLPAEFVCGGRLKSAAGDGQWVYSTPTENHAVLCFTETGEERDVLPADQYFWESAMMFESWIENVPEISPDNRWLLLIGSTEAGWVIYAYEIETNTLSILGNIQRDTFKEMSPDFRTWVNATTGIVQYITMSSSLPDDFYVFDVVQPNSLQLTSLDFVMANESQSDTSSFASEQPIVEVMTTGYFQETTGSISEHQNCTLTIVDSFNPQTIDLGYDCDMHLNYDSLQCDTLYPAAQGYLYLRFDAPPAADSSLMYVNPLTETLTQVYSGEIEQIYQASPNGRFVAFFTDNSGQIDFVDMGCQSSNLFDLTSPSLVIIYLNLNAQFISEVYQLDFSLLTFPKIFWGEEAFIIQPGDGTGTLERISANGDILTYTPDRLGSIKAASDDLSQVIIEIGAGEFAWLDLNTQTSTPITAQSLTGGDYGQFIEVQFNDDNTLSIKTSDGTVYTIRLKSS